LIAQAAAVLKSATATGPPSNALPNGTTTSKLTPELTSGGGGAGNELTFANKQE